MFTVPDGTYDLRPHVGSPWRCTRCDVGLTSPDKPDCWNCCRSDRMIPAHQYRTPTSSSSLRTRLTADPPEEP